MNKLLQDEKNIDSIFFYAINNDLNYLGFFYTANKVKYKKDYKDIDFIDSVNRLKKVYNTLKDINNINLIGDLTKEIMNEKIKIAYNQIYNKTLLNTNEYECKSMLLYIKFIIKKTMDALGIDSDTLTIKDGILKYNDFVSSHPLNKSNLTNINYIPITFYKTDNGYKLKFRLYKNNKDYVFSSDINIYNKSIIIYIYNDEYEGEIIFDKLNIDNSICFKKDETIVYYDNLDNDITDYDKDKIQKVFNMLNLDYEINGIKTIDNNFILYNSNNNYEYYIKLNIKNDLIRLNLKKYIKYQKDGIDFKPIEEVYDYLIIKYDEKNILIQQKYLMTENSNNTFKQNINKSKYFILHTDRVKDSLLDSNILTREEIFIEELNDIKKLIKED